MTTKNVTITSKNQITLPAELVRNLKLTKRRRLTIRQRGGELILTPEPELEERLKVIWRQLPPFQGTRTDEELKKTAREAWARKKI